MRIFLTREFSRSNVAREVGKLELINAARELNAGLWDANLGGQVFKKRIALGGRGKRSGARTIVVFKRDERLFFIHAFAKNQKDGISIDELRALRRLAKELLGFNQNELSTTLSSGELIEIEG